MAEGTAVENRIRTYWKESWPSSSEERTTREREELFFLLSLVGVPTADLCKARILIVGNGPVAALAHVKAIARVAIDPNNDFFIEEGLLRPSDGDGETLYLSADLRDNTLPAGYFDIVFLNFPVGDADEALGFLTAALRIAASGSSIGINLTIGKLGSDGTPLIPALPDGCEDSLALVDVNGQHTLRGHVRLPGVNRMLQSRTDSVRLQYPANIAPRYDTRNPNHFLQLRFSQHDDKYAGRLGLYERFRPNFAAIPPIEEQRTEPFWENGWIPVLDGVTLYAEVALANPDFYVEVGSGNSTKFVRRAIRDQGLRTRIISIDPNPRSEIDQLCDQVYRISLEEFRFTEIERLGSSRVVFFFDGSHYCFQNTDVTAFYLELLPRVQKEWLIGIHDINLPCDYLNADMKFYNEQYLLAPLILEEAIDTVFPSFYVTTHPVLGDRARSIVKHFGRAWPGGATYWFCRKGGRE